MNIQELAINSVSILGTLVAALLLLWRQPPLRKRVFGWIGKAPQWAQPIVPMALAGIAAAGQGYLDGVRGEELLTLGASQAGQAGIYAIGIWHTAKRWWPVVVRIWRATRKTNIATVVACFIASVPLLCCTGTFEEARVAQPGALQASPARASSSRCVTLSDRDWLYGGIAKGGTVLTGATGISALPLEGRYETAAAVTTLTIAAGTAASLWYSQSAGAEYIAEGCAK